MDAKKQKQKRSWKMWAVVWPDGTLVAVKHTKAEIKNVCLYPQFKQLGVKIKRVTVIEGEI